MDKKWLFIGIAFLMILFTVVGAMAYEVNRPLDVRVKLQYDNGVVLSDVVSQACIMSVYFQGDSSLVVRDVNMSAGSYHSFNFTPSQIGDYVLSVRCDFNNESAVYHETVSISGQTVSPPSGGQVLNLNAKIVPEETMFVVNIAVEPKLEFGVNYYRDGKLANSGQAEYRILSGDVVLYKSNFVIKNTGEYVFDYDFKDQLTGSYRVALYFDGRTEFVDVKVISVSEDLSSITGFVMNSDGEVSVFKAGMLIFFVLFILLLVFVFVRSLKKGGKK